MPHANPDEAKAWRRAWYARRIANDEEFAAKVKAQRKAARTPEMHRAGEAVRRAIKSGRLERPSMCDRCGGVGPIEAAHHDYEKKLDVAWLCRPCHRRDDAANPKSIKECKP